MAKIVIDLNQPATSFEKDKSGIRKPMFSDKPDATLGWCLNNFILAPCRDQPPQKILVWIFDLDDNGKLELDESDFDLLKKIIEEDRMNTALLKGQILLAMKKAKEASERP